MYDNEGSEKDALNNIFTYHAPMGTQTERYTAIRETAKQFANLIMDFCPTSREKDVAIERIRESVMWANASIAVNEVDEISDPDHEPSTASGM
jgi:hypothetical protein